MWTIEHEADIASDLSAFHRIDDPLSIDGPRYFSLAQRVGAYSGVMAAIYAERQRREQEGNGGAPSGSSASSQPAKVDDVVAIANLSDGWVEYVKEGADA
jgi:hypothetical protein